MVKDYAWFRLSIFVCVCVLHCAVGLGEDRGSDSTSAVAIRNSTLARVVPLPRDKGDRCVMIKDFQFGGWGAAVEPQSNLSDNVWNGIIFPRTKGLTHFNIISKQCGQWTRTQHKPLPWLYFLGKGI